MANQVMLCGRYVNFIHNGVIFWLAMLLSWLAQTADSDWSRGVRDRWQARF